MLRKIHLHGSLRKLHPTGVIELESDTVAEALNGMARILKIKPNIWSGRPQFKVQGCDSIESIFEPSAMVDLHVVPAFTGSGNTIRIIIGAILVVVGIATGNYGIAIAGAGLLIGGLMAVLFPTKQEQPGTNHYIQAAGNTVAIGTRISILVGEAQAYGQILSYNVDSSDITGNDGDGNGAQVDGDDDRTVYTS